MILISLSLNGSAAAPQPLAGAPAFKFKQRSYRRITMDSLDGFAQKPRHRQRDNLHAADRRAQDSISCYQFVNRRFAQSFDPHLVEDGMGNAGQDLPGALLLEQLGRRRPACPPFRSNHPPATRPCRESRR